MNRQHFTGLLVAALLLVPVASAQWSDNFDAYVAGTGLNGQGGWECWDANPAADALVSDLYALSSPNSAEILTTSDLIHQWTGATSGLWIFTCYQYVPTDFTGQGYFLMLNTYNHGGPYNWSIQVMIDAAGVITSDPEGATLPLIRGQWVEIRVEIDLTTDVQTFYYGGQMLFQKSWIDGMSGGGVANIACVDLYGNTATSIFYDDMSLCQGVSPVEESTWGQIKSLYR